MVVVRASSGKRLRETAKEIEKCSHEQLVVERLKEMWKSVEADAPGNNFET